MALLTGFMALGTGYGPGYTFQEVSGGSYARVAAALTGAYNTGLTQTVSTFAAATAPVGLPMRLGAIYDLSTGGNLLCSWEMPFPLTPVGTALPSTVFNMVLSTGVIAAMANLNNVFQAGSQIGTMNGAPLVAGVTLINSSTGNLTFEPAQGTIVVNPIVMVGGVAVARFDAAGNLTIRGQLNSPSAVNVAATTI